MANLEENEIFEEHIYEISDEDPVGGGPNGVVNVQSRQIANRTRWLKQYADQVADAIGDNESLSDRLSLYDNFDPENVERIDGVAENAKETAETAMEEVEKITTKQLQSGVTVITNRGIITGCTVSKSDNAIRNLSLSAGTLFVGGGMLSCPAMNNSAIVASNTTDDYQECYGYLYQDGNTLRFSVTEFGSLVPDNGIPICLIAVPAGNNQVSDPNLDTVTITDVRRVEVGYPTQVNSRANVSVALDNPIGDSEYAVYLDVLDFKGGYDQSHTVYVRDKATNGFKVYVDGSIDSVTVRWTAVKLDIQE